MARQMGIDPYEFRKKNVLLRGDFVCKGTPRMDTDYLDLMARSDRGHRLGRQIKLKIGRMKPAARAGRVDAAWR